jgi:hypothetical protein
MVGGECLKFLLQLGVNGSSLRARSGSGRDALVCGSHSGEYCVQLLRFGWIDGPITKRSEARLG